MMNGGLSGFYNAPVSRGFIVASAVFSVLFGIQRRSNKLGLSYQVFILFSSIISLLLEALTVVVLKVSPSNFLASGPYGLIYALFIPFYFDIQFQHIFKYLGSNFLTSFYYSVAAFVIFLEKVRLAWHLWHCCWFPVQDECLWHLKGEVSGICVLILFTSFVAVFGQSTHTIIEKRVLKLSINYSSTAKLRFSAFNGRTIGGIYSNACFDGLRQGLCETSACLSQKRYQCGLRYSSRSSISVTVGKTGSAYNSTPTKIPLAIVISNHPRTDLFFGMI